MFQNFDKVIEHLERVEAILDEVSRPTVRTFVVQSRHRNILLRILQSIDNEIEVAWEKKEVQGNTPNNRKKLRKLYERRNRCLTLLK